MDYCFGAAGVAASPFAEVAERRWADNSAAGIGVAGSWTVEQPAVDRDSFGSSAVESATGCPPELPVSDFAERCMYLKQSAAAPVAGQRDLSSKSSTARTSGSATTLGRDFRGWKERTWIDTVVAAERKSRIAPESVA